MNKTRNSLKRCRWSKERLSPAKAGSAVEQYYSKTIGRGLDVLECFSDEDSVFNFKEIGQFVNLPGPSLFRILLTLESRGYLVRNSDGSFQFARKLLLGKLAERSEHLIQTARPELQKLSNRFDETSSLGYLVEDCIQALDTVETFHEIRVTNRPGRILPPHCSAMGKAITAFQNQLLANRILEVYGLTRPTARTVTDRNTLQVEFERIRTQRYAVDNEESIEGGICVSAPIFAKGGRVIAAISVSTPSVRMNPDRQQEMIQAVKKSAGLVIESLKKSRFSGVVNRSGEA